ncbi:MAG TPA: PAS domain-containing hybrid sensor histidine kinase/response regulator [Novosphingobium capsulatum]|jgi:signal transduction histidine kinase|nr:PAS domain-containing hybrid sensor histidine kinase/response regulator [Novosphingobium capsulatum]
MATEISDFWTDPHDDGRSLLELVALKANDGIWGWDVPTGRSFYSARWWDLVGLPADHRDADIDVFFSLLHPDDRAPVRAMLADFIANARSDYRAQFRLRHSSGEWRWILSSGSAQRDASGHAVRIAGTHTDITDRVEAANRLEHLVAQRTSDLAAARDRAEIAAASTARFLSATSHDIRQPLQAMALLLRNLQQEVHSKAALDTIASIRRSLGSSMELLDDLLEFSRLDAGALRPEMGPIKIQSLFRGVLDSFSAEGQERGLRLVVRDTPLVGRSDPRLLTRILRNLVSNSFKFTQRGTILVAARPRGDRIRIEIWDTGRGIPEGMQRQIFWEFTQAGPASSDRTVNGLGLGLAIVERLARLMRHEIGVRSVVDRGSVFWIDLPRLPLDAAEDHHEPAEPPDHPLGCRVAVAENDPQVAEAYLRVLRAWGCKVLVARSGAELLSRIANQPPDLLIADCHLDGQMNGFELFDALEQRFGRPFAGVVISGDHNFEWMRTINRARRRILNKPILPDVLNAVLHAELERPELQRYRQT